MRKSLLVLLSCLVIASCADRSQQILGSWRCVEHYDQDSTEYPYIKYLEGITVYEFHKGNCYKEHHYIEVLRGERIEKTSDQLRYTGTWNLSGDTLIVHKAIKELRPYYGDMDTTEIDETETYYILSLTRDSLIAKIQFYRTFLYVRLERVKEKRDTNITHVTIN